MTVQSDDDSDGQQCKARTLDLREPPSRSDVGLEPGSSGTSWSCDAGYTLTLVLPSDIRMELVVRQVSFSTYSSGDVAPETVDINSTWLSIDEAADLSTTISKALAMPTTEIQKWRREAQNPPDPTLDTKTLFIRGSAGDIDAEMQVIHQSVDGKNNVHLILHLPKAG